MAGTGRAAGIGQAVGIALAVVDIRPPMGTGL